MFKKQILIMLMLFASFATAKSIGVNQPYAPVAESRLQNPLNASPANIDDAWGTVTINGAPYTMNSTSTLIDADIALLDLKAQGNAGTATVSASIGGTSYSGYQNVYDAVYNLLVEHRTHSFPTDGHNGEYIWPVDSQNDAIWYIEPGQRATLQNSYAGQAKKRLVVCGDGTLRRVNNQNTRSLYVKGDNTTPNPTICLQGNVTIDGSKDVSTNIHTWSMLTVEKGTVYIADNVKVTNCAAKRTSTALSSVNAGGGAATVLSDGRLYMMGNAVIEKSESTHNGAGTTEAMRSNGGAVCIQGGVFKMMDNAKISDCNTSTNASWSLGGAVYMTSGTFTMDGNAVIEKCTAKVGGAVYMLGGTFTMNAGLIGSKDAVVHWTNDEGVVETTTYPNTPTADYAYITDITNSENGNQALNAGILYAQGGNVVFNGGDIVGNYTSVDWDQNGTITYENREIYFGSAVLLQKNAVFECHPGTVFYGNKSDGSVVSLVSKDRAQSVHDEFYGGSILCNYEFKQYGAGIAVGMNVIADLNGPVDVSYNTTDCNGGGLVVLKSATLNLLSNQITITHNVATGNAEVPEDTNVGNGGAFRVVGTLNIHAGTIAHNFARGYIGNPDDPNDDSGCGGAISATTDNRGGNGLRIAEVNLYGGKIEYNRASRYGGGVYLSSYMTDVATFTLQGTEICHNSSDFDGGGCYLSARMGELKAELKNGKLSDNTANYNGGGLYFTILQEATKGTLNIDDTDPVKMMKIENNESYRNGGGIYIANETEVVAPVTMYNGLVKENTSVKGAGFYVEGGDVTVKSGNIDDNIAYSDGGGCYVNGGDVTIEAGSLSGNSSVNGGGVYVDGGNFTFMNGTISGNTASKNGGGAYVSGGDVTFKGSLIGNTAANGGGLYLGPEANMTFKGGLIIENKAEIPDGATSAGTAYHGSSANIMGCGGGIYLQNGTSSKKTTLNFALDPNDKTFGLYTNRANMAGDDLVAEGQYTEVVLPSVREMQLYGFEGKDATPFWYQDYFTGDTGYRDNPDDGRAVTNEVNYIGRFREMKNMFTNEYYNHRIADDFTNLNRIKNNYLCLTLSYNMLDITLTANHLQGHETALFQLIRHGNIEDKKYDVLLKKDGNGIASRTLRNMPWGTYSVIPNDAWNWLYEKIPVQMNLRLGETGNYEFVFDMKHHNTASLPQHDERQPGIEE